MKKKAHQSNCNKQKNQKNNISTNKNNAKPLANTKQKDFSQIIYSNRNKKCYISKNFTKPKKT